MIGEKGGRAHVLLNAIGILHERKQKNIEKVVLIEISGLVICILKVGRDGKVVNNKFHVSLTEKPLLLS